MKNALIGHTGFVGSNLLTQGNFSHTYNTKNIHDIENENFDQVWCSGISAVKWWANKNPAEDLEKINALLVYLKTVKCKKFILISTVDVFMSAQNVTENDIPMRENLHAYGLHRLMVEDFARKHFENVTIIRLPGLFGQGLKKNIIYDFMHDNEVHKIDSRNIFQFYDLANIYSHCVLALENNLKLLHLATEPLQVANIAKEVFNLDFHNVTENNVVSYSMKTCYANLFNKQGDYIASSQEIIEQIKNFVKNNC